MFFKQENASTWKEEELKEIQTFISGIKEDIAQWKKIRKCFPKYVAPELADTLEVNVKFDDKPICLPFKAVCTALHNQKLRVATLEKILDSQNITEEERQLLLEVEAIAKSQIICDYKNVLKSNTLEN